MSNLDISKIQKDVLEYENSKKEQIISVLNEIRFSNKNVKVLNESPRIFTVNSSYLFSERGINLSPEYYDYDAQFDAIIEGIRSRSLKDSISFLEKVIEEKRFTFKNAHGKFVFHDDVINKLKETFKQ